MTQAKKLILFEPWHMGDALIAFSIALQAPSRLILACHPRWHIILGVVAEGLQAPELLSLDQPYINKKKPKPWQLGELTPIDVHADVVSIRGDIRDYVAATKIFPQSKVRFTGWTAFFARRNALVNVPFGRGWIPIRNRYRAWASITGVPWPEVENFYRLTADGITRGQSIAIHVGAQWGARQYPHVAELANALREYVPVQIVAGPGDPLPAGIQEQNVVRVINRELVDVFRNSSHVICNDSGPMHLAAILRRPTIVLSRLSAIEEWLPPSVVALRSKMAPRGYMPDPNYETEGEVTGWPAIDEVVQSMQTSFQGLGLRAHSH